MNEFFYKFAGILKAAGIAALFYAAVAVAAALLIKLAGWITQ